MAQILDRWGTPIPRGEILRARAGSRGALIGQQGRAFDAADRTSPEMVDWNPVLGSPDGEISFDRDTAVARIRDLVRNDGWASGAVTRLCDATVGAELRLSAKPDYRALRRRWNVAFDAAWAREFASAAEAAFRAWGSDPAKYCDLGRRWTFGQMARLGFRHYLVEGETVAVIPWRSDRVGYGRARYATTVKLVDPDRLSNPQLRMDSQNLRGGIELDDDDVAIAYHFRRAHQQDWFTAADSVTWERVPRETEFGRPLVIHHFDAERAGQHRPIGGIFAPVLARMRMLAQYDRVELQAALVNAIFGAYIESPYDPDDVQAGMTADELAPYQQQRGEFHRDRRIMAGNVRFSTLYPGERAVFTPPSRPNTAFDAFEGAVLRNFAAAIGASVEMVSQDYRGMSYSTSRQSLLEGWRTISRRRIDFGVGVCTPIYGCVLEEAIARGDVPLPAGAPDFAEARAEYARCSWIGPGRGWVDPTKEPEGSRMKIASGLSTLEREAEEGGGADWEENLDQLALEQEAIRERRLDITFESKGGAPTPHASDAEQQQQQEGVSQ